MTLSENIKKARIENKLTQTQLANLLTENGCKVTNATISNWELNISEPNADTILLLCKLLNKDANYFFGISDTDPDADILLASHNAINLDGFSEESKNEIREYIKFKRTLNEN